VQVIFCDYKFSQKIICRISFEFKKGFKNKEMEVTPTTEFTEERKVVIRRCPQPTWTILDMAAECPPIGWQKLFASSVVELRQISDLIEARKKSLCVRIVPSVPNVFKAFELTPLDNVRVIFIGMDPYQTLRYDGKPRAQGLSFSIKRDDDITPSLRNMFKALKYNYPDYRIPFHGDLTAWAKQGVLLLNASLTTDVDKSGAHGQIWFPFLKCVIEAIKKVNPNFITVLLGRDAQKLESFIGGKDTHTLSGPHPAARGGEFLKCPIFRNVNYLLKQDGFSEIDWSL
jgi:uracil-DNA glycosylase